MKRTIFLSLIAVLALSGCAGPGRSSDEAMLNFLPYLNQKVAGYMDANGKDNLDTDLDTESYKSIIAKVCEPLPACGKNVLSMRDEYDINVRMLDGMFSVMLCDKISKRKIMEDFSCNEQIVELPTFQINENAQCSFDEKWQTNITPYCVNSK